MLSCAAMQRLSDAITRDEYRALRAESARCLRSGVDSRAGWPRTSARQVLTTGYRRPDYREPPARGVAAWRAMLRQRGSAHARTANLRVDQHHRSRRCPISRLSTPVRISPSPEQALSNLPTINSGPDLPRG